LPRWARDGHRFSLTIAVSAQATAFIDLPSGQHVALAATWDPRRAELIGSLLAAECRRKDVDVLLAPTANLQRSPFGGRNFEFFGEDPFLTAAMGGAPTCFVKATTVGRSRPQATGCSMSLQ
jgi:Glycosyl hydrolase family 3 N terminal domain